MSKYSEKFKDPRWQKKRLKVFKRDDFVCQKCLDDKATLNAHHRYYKPNTDPWDYPLDSLVTLCEDCHSEEREIRPRYEKSLIFALREKFLAEDISEIAMGFHCLAFHHQPEVVASVYAWALQDDKTQKLLIKLYFEAMNKNYKKGK